MKIETEANIEGMVKLLLHRLDKGVIAAIDQTITEYYNPSTIGMQLVLPIGVLKDAKFFKEEATKELLQSLLIARIQERLRLHAERHAAQQAQRPYFTNNPMSYSAPQPFSQNLSGWGEPRFDQPGMAYPTAFGGPFSRFQPARPFDNARPFINVQGPQLATCGSEIVVAITAQYLPADGQGYLELHYNPEIYDVVEAETPGIVQVPVMVSRGQISTHFIATVKDVDLSIIGPGTAAITAMKLVAETGEVAVTGAYTPIIHRTNFGYGSFADGSANYTGPDGNFGYSNINKLPTATFVFSSNDPMVAGTEVEILFQHDITEPYTKGKVRLALDGRVFGEADNNLPVYIEVPLDSESSQGSFKVKIRPGIAGAAYIHATAVELTGVLIHQFLATGSFKTIVSPTKDGANKDY